MFLSRYIELTHSDRSFFYTSPIHCVSEIDGIRLITSEVCDFIQKVPASSVSIFRPGSTSPAAILFDAWENFNKKSPKADDDIRSIRPELAKAVDECIDSAGREWEPHWQRRLLNVRCSVTPMCIATYLAYVHPGSQVRPFLPRPLQPYRLRHNGANSQGSQRCSLL